MSRPALTRTAAKAHHCYCRESGKPRTQLSLRLSPHIRLLTHLPAHPPVCLSAHLPAHRATPHLTATPTPHQIDTPFIGFATWDCVYGKERIRKVGLRVQ
jgi:hypothetical protein